MTAHYPKYWHCASHGVKGLNASTSYQDHCNEEHEGNLISVSFVDQDDHPAKLVGPAHPHHITPESPAPDDNVY